MTLKLIQGGDSQDEIISCPKCGGVSWVNVTHTMRRRNGKNTKGIRAMSCLGCLINGKTTLIPGGI